MEISVQGINALMQNTQEKIVTAGVSLSPSLQNELSKTLSIAHKLKGLLAVAQAKGRKAQIGKIEALIPSIEFILYIFQGVPNEVLVKNSIRDLEFEVRKLENPFLSFFINGFYSFLYSTSTPTKVVLGLFVALPIHLLAPLLLIQLLVSADSYLQPLFAESAPELSAEAPKALQNAPAIANVKVSQYEFNEASVLIILAAVAGSTGSIVSIMTRLQQYQNEDYSDALLPVFIGAFKPAVGAFFGIFALALISSTILPISITEDEDTPISKWYAILAICFVVGFSERFANDIVSQAERVLPGNGSAQRDTGATALQIPPSVSSSDNNGTKV